MGFPSISYGVIVPKPLVKLADFWIHIKLMVRLAFFYLGLFDPTDVSTNWEDHGSRRSTVDTHSPSVSITPQEIKKRLPIVEFADFVRWSGAGECEEAVCAVCLSCVEERHEIRELGNCSHVFHVGCLDKWVDQGQVTCPMCRSMLLPREHEKKRGGDSWVVERISYLFGEDLVRY
ncbi:brassinosteroid-responsive RING protein 1-like [Aristolochia californica]|uniref:brassinosteroid-responsive RING protein 1-like n=1 Tax=Aristolochia californica TaxID=171875 RepID=UPI0035D56993